MAKKFKIRLPRKPELGKNQQEFYSVNGKNYMVRLGEEVEVPEPLYNLIMDNQRAEDAAYEYQSTLPTAASPDENG